MMLVMQWASAQDRSVYVMVGPSGGRPDLRRIAEVSATLHSAAHPENPGRRPGIVELVADSLFYPYLARLTLLGAIGRWLVHWVIFRGGWTVYVDAPDRDPAKVRCANRAAARARAAELVATIEADGVGVVDELDR